MISLCIPTYNRIKDLKHCLNSIIGKFGDYPYEVIIADGGSKDGTIEYIKELNDEHIKLIEQRKLTGITKAFNESFKIAKGDYIYIGNDDTILFPEIFIKCCKLMDEHERIGLVAPKDQEPRHGNFPGVTLKLRNYWALLSKFHIFRASVLKEIGYYDENLRSYYTDDDSCLSVLTKGYTIAFSREVGMIHYRIPDQSVNIARATNQDSKNVEKELKYLKIKWEILKNVIDEYLKSSSFKRYKSLYCAHICSKIYHSKPLQHVVTKGLYDFLLERSVVFKDNKYDNLKDFYLAQRYPDEILSSSDKINKVKYKTW